MSTNLRAQTLTRPTNKLASSDEPWWDRAACQGGNPSEWDSCSPAAKRICFLDCAVRAECLADALDYEGRPGAIAVGLRGGLNPDQRSKRRAVKNRG